MARLPSTALLGISMMGFAGLVMCAVMKHYGSVPHAKAEADGFEIMSFVLGLIMGIIGAIVHGANLDTEPAARSFGMAFLGANAGLVYIYFMVEPDKWQDWSPLVLAIAILGLLAGVTSYEGDPQAMIKSVASLEDQAKKDLAAAKEAKASWDKWMADQKMKAAIAEKKD